MATHPRDPVGEVGDADVGEVSTLRDALRGWDSSDPTQSRCQMQAASSRFAAAATSGASPHRIMPATGFQSQDARPHWA